MIKIIQNKNVIFLLRVILGGLFIISSFDKIIFVSKFEKVLNDYDILPQFLIHPIAIILPWIEFISGILLILNIYSQSNSLIMLFLLIIFISAIAINMIRGISEECGCFDLLGISEKIGFGTLLRDFIFLLFTLPVLIFGDNKLKL
jgi:uncharacterized membrane protein YphA (DoxX/SURF4 family)